jgi:hypothetical protein
VQGSEPLPLLTEPPGVPIFRASHQRGAEGQGGRAHRFTSPSRRLLVQHPDARSRKPRVPPDSQQRKGRAWRCREQGEHRRVPKCIRHWRGGRSRSAPRRAEEMRPSAPLELAPPSGGGWMVTDAELHPRATARHSQSRSRSEPEHLKQVSAETRGAAASTPLPPRDPLFSSRQILKVKLTTTSKCSRE